MPFHGNIGQGSGGSELADDWFQLYSLGHDYDVWGGEDPFDPDAGWDTGEIQDIEAGIETYWESLQDPEGWEREELPGGWDIYGSDFDPWEGSSHQEYVNMLKDQARTEIASQTVAWDLLQSQSLADYNLAGSHALEDWQLLQEQSGDTWSLAHGGYLQDITDLGTMWDLRQEDFERLGIDAQAVWDIKKLALERQTGEAEDIYDLKATELLKQGIDAEELWTLSKNDLDALGIDASEIWDIERASLKRRQSEASDIWGMQGAEYGRKAGAAVDMFNLQAADIARRKEEAGTMWGLQEEAFRETWTTEKEKLAFGTQAGIKKAKKTQSQAILATGFATAPIGIQDMERDVRRQYGMELSAGEEQLANQLQIGSEQLVQTLAGLQSDLNMGAEQLENTLAELSVSRDISEAQYNSDIANLATQIGIGAEELKNKLESYDREQTRSKTILSQELERLKREGLINDEMEAQLIAEIQDGIDIGAKNLANTLGGLTALESQELAQYNINVANVHRAIALGELTLEQALAEGQVTYDQAIESGLLTLEGALATGATAYELAVGNIYTDLQSDIWFAIDSWRREQESILRDIVNAADSDDLVVDPESEGSSYPLFYDEAPPPVKKGIEWAYNNPFDWGEWRPWKKK